MHHLTLARAQKFTPLIKTATLDFCLNNAFLFKVEHMHHLTLARAQKFTPLVKTRLCSAESLFVDMPNLLCIVERFPRKWSKSSSNSSSCNFIHSVSLSCLDSFLHTFLSLYLRVWTASWAGRPSPCKSLLVEGGSSAKEDDPVCEAHGMYWMIGRRIRIDIHGRKYGGIAACTFKIFTQRSVYTILIFILQQLRTWGLEALDFFTGVALEFMDITSVPVMNAIQKTTLVHARSSSAFMDDSSKPSLFDSTSGW